MHFTELENKLRNTQNLWSEAANRIINEKTTVIKELTEKLNQLEYDFKYNYDLLKIRERENIQCRNEVVELNRCLVSKVAETKQLGVQLEIANDKIAELEKARFKDKSNLKKLAVILTNNRNELSNKITLVNEQTQQLVQSNHEIQKLREQNFELVTQLEIHKKEAETFKRNCNSIEASLTNSLLVAESKFNSLKRDCTVLEMKNKRLESVKCELEQQLKAMELQNKVSGNLEEVNRSLSVQVQSLRATIEEISKQNSQINENYQNLKEMTCGLVKDRNEILTLVQSLRDNPDHAKLVKQNLMLIDVLKKVKNERDHLKNANLANSLLSCSMRQGVSPNFNNFHGSHRL